HAANTVLNSEGETRGSGTGLYAGYSATNCVGRTHDGIGLYAVNTGSGCFGDNDSSMKPGLKSDGVLSTCTAQNFGTGPAMSTCIAIGCVTFGGPINASCSKQLGTP